MKNNSTANPSMAAYHLEISRHPLLTRAEERELGRRIQQGDPEARERMIESNLRLVVTIAHDYAHRGLPIEDLIAEGNIGLMKAADRYDPENGAKFSTYAAWWIKQQMRSATQNQVRTIRVPTHIQARAWHLDKASAALEEEWQRDPTTEELAQATDLTPEQVELTRRSVQPITHLETSIGARDGETEFGDLVADVDAPMPDEAVIRRDAIDEVRRFLHLLSDREQRILRIRFGIDNDEPATLNEVGTRVGLTRERVRQIQNQALIQLRNLFDEVETPSGAAVAAAA